MSNDPVISAMIPIFQHAYRLHVHRYQLECALLGRTPVPIPQVRI